MSISWYPNNTSVILCKNGLIYFLSKLTGDYKIDVTLLFVSFYILKNLLLGAITFHVHTIQKQLQANIESRMFQKILKQPYREFIKKNSSDEIRKII